MFIKCRSVLHTITANKLIGSKNIKSMSIILFFLFFCCYDHMFLVHTYMKDTNTRSKHEHVRSQVLYTVYLEKDAYAFWCQSFHIQYILSYFNISPSQHWKELLSPKIYQMSSCVLIHAWCRLKWFQTLLYHGNVMGYDW